MIPNLLPVVSKESLKTLQMDLSLMSGLTTTNHNISAMLFKIDFFKYFYDRKSII